MYNGDGGYDYGRSPGTGGAFPNRSYPLTAQMEPAYYQHRQQSTNFGPSSSWGAQQQMPQRQAAGMPLTHTEGLLNELRDSVAPKDRFSPIAASMISRAAEAVAVQRRSGGFQSSYHQQEPERSIESIRQAAGQRMDERNQQMIYREQEYDSGRFPIMAPTQLGPAVSFMGMRSAIDYEQPDMYRGPSQPSVGPMFNTLIPEVSVGYNRFSYGDRGLGNHSETRSGSFPTKGRGSFSDDRGKGFRDRGGGRAFRGGRGTVFEGSISGNKRNFPHQKQEEVVRKKPLFSADKGQDRRGRGSFRGRLGYVYCF